MFEGFLLQAGQLALVWETMLTQHLIPGGLSPKTTFPLAAVGIFSAALVVPVEMLALTRDSLSMHEAGSVGKWAETQWSGGMDNKETQQK